MKAPRQKKRLGYQRFLQELVHEYQRVHQVDTVDLHEVARWAYINNKWHEQPYDPIKKLRTLMSRALATEYTIDPQGREVRSMIAVPVVNAIRY